MKQLMSERLTLIPIDTSDRALVVALNTDAQVMTFVAEPQSVEAANRIFDIILRQTQAQPPKMYCWKITTAAQATAVGVISLTRMKGEYQGWLEIGALSLPAFYGKGYIPEAMELVCADALERDEIKGIYAKFQAEHQASLRITRKTHFSTPHPSADFPGYLECTRRKTR